MIIGILMGIYIIQLILLIIVIVILDNYELDDIFGSKQNLKKSFIPFYFLILGYKSIKNKINELN